MQTLLRTPYNSRRKTSRVHTSEDVRVYWSGDDGDDVFCIRNLSLGGVFIETRNPRSMGAVAQIDFLVQEGQIRSKAVVHHVQRAAGMGLEFTAIAQEDRPHLEALLVRLRTLSPPPLNSA